MRDKFVAKFCPYKFSYSCNMGFAHWLPWAWIEKKRKKVPSIKNI